MVSLELKTRSLESEKIIAPRIRKIVSLQIHIGYLTFSKNLNKYIKSYQNTNKVQI